MTYGVTVRVPAPVQHYDATHAEIMARASQEPPDGLIAHIARATPTGFEITEFWDSKEQADRYNQEVVWPAMQRAGVPPDGPEPDVEEFEPRSLIVVRTSV